MGEIMCQWAPFHYEHHTISLRASKSACRLEAASTTRLRDGGGTGGGDLDDEFEEEERALQANGGARAWSMDDGPFKLVLIVNMELKMGKGKASKNPSIGVLKRHRSPGKVRWASSRYYITVGGGTLRCDALTPSLTAHIPGGYQRPEVHVACSLLLENVWCQCGVPS